MKYPETVPDISILFCSFTCLFSFTLAYFLLAQLSNTVTQLPKFCKGSDDKHFPYLQAKLHNVSFQKCFSFCLVIPWRRKGRGKKKLDVGSGLLIRICMLWRSQLETLRESLGDQTCKCLSLISQAQRSCMIYLFFSYFYL